MIFKWLDWSSNQRVDQYRKALVNVKGSTVEYKRHYSKLEFKQSHHTNQKTNLNISGRFETFLGKNNRFSDYGANFTYWSFTLTICKTWCKTIYATMFVFNESWLLLEITTKNCRPVSLKIRLRLAPPCRSCLLSYSMRKDSLKSNHHHSNEVARALPWNP